jgi:transmembrane 9 superfamily protein 2/4
VHRPLAAPARREPNRPFFVFFFFFVSQDYHWWWRAFLTSGASALYVFLYSVFYFFSRLQITKFVSAMLYMGYTAIMALEFFLLTGTTDKQPHEHNAQLRLLVATLIHRADASLSHRPGTIGFFACYYFVRQIYSSIKVD